MILSFSNSFILLQSTHILFERQLNNIKTLSYILRITFSLKLIKPQNERCKQKSKILKIQLLDMLHKCGPDFDNF